MITDTKIWITFRQHGIHCYPQAPDEVSYLRYPHRHNFLFKVTMSVTHDDREVEFHLLQRFCQSQYETNLNCEHKSCEMLARELLLKLVDNYGHRYIEVEVSEDGECGAIVTHLTTMTVT